MKSNQPMYITIAGILCFFSFAHIAAANGNNGESEISQLQGKAVHSFIENAGQVTDQNYQIRTDIDVKLNMPGVNVFIGDGAIHYQWNRPVGGNVNRLQKHPLTMAEEDRKIEIYRLDVELAGANKNAKPVLEQEQAYYESYYLPSCTDGAVAHSFNKLVYQDIYPNIDWVLYVNEKGLKYDFVVHPGGDVSNIRLLYKGAAELKSDNGNVIAVTPFGNITEQKPYSYISGTAKEVPSSFIVKGNEVSFSVAGDYHDQTLVIDPAILWASYYGGSLNDAFHGIHSDQVNLYACGYTQSVNNIVTSGAHQTVKALSLDAFLVKFTPQGTRLWGTYMGAANADAFMTIRADASGNVYAGGYTQSSSGITTAGCHQSVYGGGLDDGLLAKFNSSGVRQWSTYYGGNFALPGAAGLEGIYALAIDALANVIIGGMTPSVNNIATPGSHQGAFVGLQYNAFVAKFNPAGVRQWGTYYGTSTGYNHILVDDIITDGSSNIYCVGTADAPFTNISTAGSHQVTPGGGTTDGFMVKFNASGLRQWGTYIGGSNADDLRAIAMDANGNLYVGGHTQSSGLATVGSFQSSLGGGADAYLGKFNQSGVNIWATYYGSSGNDGIESISATTGNRICVAGITTSSTGIATPGTAQTTYNGANDAFLAVFSDAGARQAASYWGGGNLELYSSIATIGNEYAFIAGETESTTSMSTPNGHQPNFGGGTDDGFIAAFSLDTVAMITQPFNDTLLCTGASFSVAYTVNPSLNTGNVFTVQLSNAAGSFASPVSIGNTTASGSGSINCTIPLATPNGLGYRIRIVSTNPARVSLDNGKNIRISGYPTVNATGNSPLCTGATLNLASTSSSGSSLSWVGPNSFSSTAASPTISNVGSAEAGNYILSATLNGCTAKDTVAVVVTTGPGNITASSNSPVCFGQTLSLAVSGTTPGVSYSWTGPGFSSSLQNPSVSNVSAIAAGTYSVTASLNGCVSNSNTTVVINPGPIVGMYVSPNDTICSGSVATFVAVPSNAGPSPQIQWMKNGSLIAGASGLTYSTSALNNGDVVNSILISGVGGPCSLPDTSIDIVMTVVNTTTTPQVNISSNPAKPQPGQLVNFYATSVNGGPNPVYQWRRNGNDIAGAIHANWSASGLHPYDKIDVVLKSSDLCADPKQVKSEEIVIGFSTAIDEVGMSTSLMLYPNPNKGDFAISGKVGAASKVRIAVTNVLGQELYHSEILANSGEINTRIELQDKISAGIYFIKISNGNETAVVKFIVE